MIFNAHRLNDQFKTFLWDNFNTSVIVPIQDDLAGFKLSIFQNMKFFLRNGIELVVVVSQLADVEEILAIAKAQSLINWRIFIFDGSLPHAINLGILQSSKDFVFILPPSVTLDDDAIYALRYPCEYYLTSYSVCKVDDGDAVSNSFVFLTRKKLLLDIDLFDERLDTWHELYFNTVGRLELNNVTRVFIDEELLTSLNSVFFSMPNAVPSSVYYPKAASDKKGIDIRSFCYKLLYDWENNKHARELCLGYLDRFEKFEISDLLFDGEFALIALIQTRNEIQHIEDLLYNLAIHADGIIMLDDGSTDGTYEKATHPKLLLKTKKVYAGFNDLENRNLLLDLVSYIRCKWIFFQDADERIDAGFGSPRQFLDAGENVSTVGFYLVNMSGENTYLAGIRDTNPLSVGGLLFRWRMFRNIGRTQIRTTKSLHFRLVPYLKDAFTSNILVRHLIKETHSGKAEKLAFYRQHDPKFKHNESKGIYDMLIADPLVSESFNISLGARKKIL